MKDLQYPIGKYLPQEFSFEQKKNWIADIEFLPTELENAIINLDEHQLATAYREDGWTVHQVVHHVADSHMNAFIRFKLGLTEVNPTIKPYNEAAWAELEDVKSLPINISLTILHALHKRLVVLLNSISDEQWNRTIEHPQYKQQMTLWYVLGLYAWHGKHHTAHIKTLRELKQWH